jgi:RNA polymerase sigma factor (sigma-70 family)
MHIQLVQEFDRFFANKYDKLLYEAQSITSHSDISSDLVNDTYLKVRQRIWLSGFTGTNYHGFCWRSIQNEWKVLCNRKKIRTFIDIGDTDNHYHDINLAEQVLLDIEHDNNNQEEYYQKIEYIVRMLFNYIETRYDSRASFIFKFYFVEGITYEELSNRINYSQAYISNTIKPMKKDLKNNFRAYLISKQNGNTKDHN